MTNNERSALALKDMLGVIIKKPESISAALRKELLTAFNSQGGMAKFESEQYGITGCSLNTLKVSSESVIDGGWEKVNFLRINALELLKAVSPEIKRNTNRQTLSGCHNRIKDLESQLDDTRKSTHKYSELCAYLIGRLGQYAKDSEKSEIQELYKRDLKEIRAKLSFIGEVQDG